MLSVLVIVTLACGATGSGPVVPKNTSPPPTQAGNIPSGTPGGDLTRDQRSALIAATVRIYGVKRFQGELQPIYVGSGTLVSADGLILTNAHVASPASQGDTQDEPDALAVAVIESEDKAPVFSYLAEVRAVDGWLDLAVIQITSLIDGAEVNPDELNLPFVPLGDSDSVRIGDKLYIFGYPSIGGDTITFTSGSVSGFTAEDPIGDRAWIKTDATISGGNSGGLGADSSGQIIGVPTIASSGADTDVADCRVVQDTNGDGELTNDDTCIPIGGFINGLRPVNLAVPLIEAARRGRQYNSPYGEATNGQAQEPSEPGTGNEQFSNPVWYTVDANDNFDQAVDQYPSGTKTIVITFDFAEMTDGQAWREVWTQDGEEVFAGDNVWDQGRRGDYYTYLQNRGDPLPDGTYEVALYAGPGMPELLRSSVVVGGGGGVTPAASGEVRVSGRVYDGDANRPIRNALVIVLNPGLTYDAWDGSESDIYTWAETDRNGRYELPDPLERGVSYTLVVQAQGYNVKYGDDLVWTDEDPDDFTLDVGLVK
jgi:S1-C subfamily serine protease